MRIGPHRLPADLALKHEYDYRVIRLDPSSIRRSLRVGEWARLNGEPILDRRVRLRRWLQLGGGWKHLQRHISRNVHGQFIADGDWDLEFKPFEIRRTVVDMFVEGLPAEQTVEYQKMLEWIRAGEFGWTRGCRTTGDVDGYFDELAQLYRRILNDGYRTQVELGNDGADEIRVCIDRDGRPCVFGGGTHRLSIAQLLELPHVPVIVKRVHARWVADCCRTYGTSDPFEATVRGITALEERSASSRSGPLHRRSS